MLNFKTNFSKTNLLRKKHKFYLSFSEDEVLRFTFPTFGELYDKIDEIDNIIHLMKMNPRELINTNAKFSAETTYGLFWGMFQFSDFYQQQIISFFNRFFEGDFKFEDREMKINNIILTKEKFDIIVLMFLIAVGERNFTEWENLIEKKDEKEIDEISSAILQKMKNNSEKIKKIKENSNKNSKSVDIDIAMLTITNSFQSINLEDIFDMNYFTFIWYYSNSSKLIDQQIQIVAAGNGLLKNFNYLT